MYKDTDKSGELIQKTLVVESSKAGVFLGGKESVVRVNVG